MPEEIEINKIDMRIKIIFFLSKTLFEIKKKTNINKNNMINIEKLSWLLIKPKFTNLKLIKFMLVKRVRRIIENNFVFLMTK